jgi:hypothetical protein
VLCLLATLRRSPDISMPQVFNGMGSWRISDNIAIVFISPRSGWLQLIVQEMEGKGYSDLEANWIDFIVLLKNARGWLEMDITMWCMGPWDPRCFLDPWRMLSHCVYPMGMGDDHRIRLNWD